jgi:2-oxoglutarate ferredoxin oxidoreductase subunit gamma
MTDTGAVQIRIGGFGGQGIIMAGSLLGKAASLYGGKEAVFTQAYGPESRGGACRADLIISDHAVDYPFVSQPDILAVMFQEAYTRFAPQLKPGGVLIVEQDLVSLDGIEDSKGSVLALPASRIATELGNRIVANVVLLGFLVAQTGVVSPDTVEQALRSTVKAKVLELNLRAFSAGMAQAPTASAVPLVVPQ